MTTMNFNADLMRIAYGCASTEETRYYLCGVHVEAHKVAGAVMVTTDGHSMLVTHDYSAEIMQGARYILQFSKDALKQLKTSREGKKNGHVRRIEITIDSPSVATGRLIENDTFVGSVVIGIIDGSFPDWRRVVPQITAEHPTLGAFETALLARFADIGKQFSDERVTEMQMAANDTASPALIRWGPSTPAFGVLMPMRGSSDAHQLPQWMHVSESAIKKHKVAAK